eukprot:s1599_g3.t2
MHLVSKLLWWLPLGLTCRDFHNSCAAWAEHGECQQNPSYMKVQCALACNSCDWFSSRCLSRESTQGITAEVANRALRNAAAGDVPGVRVLTDDPFILAFDNFLNSQEPPREGREGNHQAERFLGLLSKGGTEKNMEGKSY